MKCLVTGGAGFIGSHVVDALIKDGHEVVVVDNLSTGRRENLNPKARFYEIDIRSPALAEVFERERPEVVNHHAAQMSVRISMADPMYDAEVNVLGSLNLIRLSLQYGVKKFIYISSGGAVYGEPVYLPCDEDHPIRPLCPYGVTKFIVEQYLALFHQHYGLRYTVLRYPNVYGPRQDPNGEAGVVAIFIGRMLRGEPVVIHGTGEQMRDFVYVADVVAANQMALENGDAEVFNLGSGRGTTVNEIFRFLAAITGYRREPLYGPPKVGETFRIYLRADRVYQAWGWRPRVDLEEGLEQTVAFFRDRLG
ncbi:NAD-dependent epimerase/dehydratase family protein [Thermoflexus sp.]|uniref:NAD-dependent epimerase/dehydratase family protein n=1 Tax=Thermoflexus sp. TaxID=1969742 RepID=UPI0025DFF9C3|nr:NAD-dependent epimerase/dehydratase family protein [Thermoflexus sp.]MDW8179816.1 NAD-dependent epimerase/dehydratase family protein [Anaerolineae bacterium]MCS6962458.1 NAD-dependent epimerase/dehydratase family protein [Thermoflexus sp.]MCS7350365.1 NAD-dependent epimerase/dehydratase family protein [Thermoflexus sp.]MCX7689790.1 NAD-dependent epimerase/dehydratase family protein [Thermoflexus sp.]MDW8184277.1 NAD-dependent epimerase/dehydratase family protein [Anaerolineae bacterium]